MMNLGECDGLYTIHRIETERIDRLGHREQAPPRGRRPIRLALAAALRALAARLAPAEQPQPATTG